MNKIKILIVDDREYDRILYKEYLGDFSYEFGELDDGDLIEEYLSSNVPSVILLDWQMPRMSGLEVLKILGRHQTYRDIPVIVITGQQDEKVLEEAFDYGGLDFIQKPVKKSELKSRVQSAVKLSEAKTSLLRQQSELKELNEIIGHQKEQLKEALKIQEENSLNKETVLNKRLQEDNRKFMSFDLLQSKINNQANSLLRQLQTLKEQIKAKDELSDILKTIRVMESGVHVMAQKEHDEHAFSDNFSKIDPAFFKKLNKINPRLTSLDLKHCAYIKLNLDNYEVSKILNVEMKSLQMTRYRLKKKLKINKDLSLREFILQV